MCPPIPYLPSSSCQDPSTAWMHPMGSTGQSTPWEVHKSPTWSTGWGSGSVWDKRDESPGDPHGLWSHCGMRGIKGPGDPHGIGITVG